MDLASMLTDTVTVQSQAGSSSYGDPTWSASKREISCCFRTRLRREATLEGTVVRSVSVLVTDQPVGSGDRFWPAGADTSDEQQARQLGQVSAAKSWWDDTTLYEADLA